MNDGTSIPSQRTDSEPVEHWLPIAGYEGRYEVSDRGRVRSLRRQSSAGKWLSPSFVAAFAETTRTGIGMRVRLMKDSKTRKYYVHRLVATAFLGCPSGSAVFHQDGDYTNCAVENLFFHGRVCVTPDCGRPFNSLGLCSTCYSRKKRPVWQWHKLSDINPENRKGVCDICGPVKVIRDSRKGEPIWTCWTVKRRAQRKRQARLYGRTPQQLDQQLAKQNGRCAICQKAKPQLSLDHDHTTGAMRDFLCHGCNTGIGFLGDSPQVARAAAAYLERHAQMELPLGQRLNVTPPRSARSKA